MTETPTPSETPSASATPSSTETPAASAAPSASASAAPSGKPLPQTGGAGEGDTPWAGLLLLGTVVAAGTALMRKK